MFKQNNLGQCCVHLCLSKDFCQRWISSWECDAYKYHNLESYTELQARVHILLLPAVEGDQLHIFKTSKQQMPDGCRGDGRLSWGTAVNVIYCEQSGAQPPPTCLSLPLGGRNPSILLWWAVQSDAQGPSLGPRGRATKWPVLPPKHHLLVLEMKRPPSLWLVGRLKATKRKVGRMGRPGCFQLIL